MSVVIVEEGEGLALTLQLEKLQKEWEEKKTQSVEVRKVLDDLKLHKLRMKRLAEELSVAEAWEVELEARRWRIEESLKPPLLGLFDKLEKEELVGDQLLREAFASGGEDLFTRKEAKAMIACLEDAEARRQQELGIKMIKLIESLTGDLKAMGQQEEELRQFAANLALFIKDIPMS